MGTPVVATDGDRDSLVYDFSGTHPKQFNINSSTGQISVASDAMLDFEGSTTEYSLTVSVTDSKDSADDYDPEIDDTIDVTVKVTDVNEPPEFIDAPSPAYSYEENATHEIDFYSATDPEIATIQWTVGGTDRDDFEIAQNGALSFSSVPDHENPTDSGRNNRYEITIVASDGSHSARADVMVSVTDEDETPEITGKTDDDYPENGTRLVDDYSAEDPERKTIVWSLSGTDWNDFAITPTGRLSFVTSPDYENPTDSGSNNSYQVVLRASDGTNTGFLTVTVTVGNEDEDGTVSLPSDQPEVGTQLTATLSDPDRVVSAVGWLWERSEGSTWSAVTTDRSYTPVLGDVGRRLRVTASYEDGHGTGKTARTAPSRSVRTTPLDNTAPEFPTTETGRRSVAENTRAGVNVGAPVRATDAEDSTLDYDMRGADAAFFSIVGSTGQIRTKDSLDHEDDDSYTFTVIAADPSGLSDSVEVTISVTDENEAPTITGDPAPRHPEHSSATVAFYSARDPEGDLTNWSLAGDDRRRFEIDGGALSFVEAPDYENAADGGRNNEYDVTVQADDGKGKTGTHTVVVSVTNEDDGGAINLSSDTPRVSSPLTATLDDPDGVVLVEKWEWEHSHGPDIWITIDGAESATYQPTDQDEGRFLRVTVFYRDPFRAGIEVQAITADVVRVGPAPPRRRPPPPPPPPPPPGPGGGSGGGGGGPEPLPPGANQPPEFSEGSRTVRSVAENSESGVNIGSQITAVDPEGDSLTYTLSGADAESFDLMSSGQLVTRAALDYETKSSHTVTVGVRDSKDPEGEPDRRRDDSIQVTVMVTNQDEPGMVTLSAPTPRVAVGLGAAVVDPDGGVTVGTWRWERSSDRIVWIPIEGAVSASYTPESGDEGQYLRVLASYTDAHGGGKTATGATDPPVTVGVVTKFEDVASEGVHPPAIKALAEAGVFADTECAERLFCPREPMQRWVMAVWMIRLLGGEPPTSGVSRFDDVADGQWWIRYAEQLADREITIGCVADPPRYCPDGSVKRAQMATFLVRALDLEPAPPAGFLDTEGNVHAANIDALAAAGITEGCSTDPLRYCPKQPVTRAQMATLLHRALRPQDEAA